MLGVFIMQHGILSADWQHERVTPKTVRSACDDLSGEASEQEIDHILPKPTLSLEEVPGIESDRKPAATLCII